MSEYSMPSYFQNMPVIGKDLSAFHEDNAAEIQAPEERAAPRLFHYTLRFGRLNRNV